MSFEILWVQWLPYVMTLTTLAFFHLDDICNSSSWSLLPRLAFLSNSGVDRDVVRAVARKLSLTCNDEAFVLFTAFHEKGRRALSGRHTSLTQIQHHPQCKPQAKTGARRNTRLTACRRDTDGAKPMSTFRLTQPWHRGSRDPWRRPNGIRGG